MEPSVRSLQPQFVHFLDSPHDHGVARQTFLQSDECVVDSRDGAQFA
jgi:hypothetical protein